MDTPTPAGSGTKTFHIELIKPSHYDNDGYVIQWWRSWIPSNSLASVYGLTMDLAEREELAPGVRLDIQAYDETNLVIPIKKIIRRIRDADGDGLVCLVGVQSNQYPRALDMARQFRAAGIQVAMGGFHVSGCISMLPKLTDELQQALDMGITLFAGEGEGRLASLFRDAYHRRMQPIYNYLADLPDMRGEPTPYLPKSHIRRYAGSTGCFDAGRGCPFACSFCTIINVQGRKSRYRDADDVERIIRVHAEQGTHRFFVTDDNFARNKNWEAIFDRLIELREQGFNVNFLIQVDTLCHKIPNFIEKAARAGCKKAFIGLENINPDSLKSVKKGQNHITEYRKMLQEWRKFGVLTYGGYILGFPGDTPETIARDLEIVKRELPIDIIEFNMLTPLPGSADHRDMYVKKEWMDPDLNKYDLEHVTMEHPVMSKDEWQGAYHKAWEIYYSPEHIETLIRRAVVSGIKPVRLMGMIFQFYASIQFEKIHPLQAGFGRRKVRTQRRHGMPRENPLIFYPRNFADQVVTNVRAILCYLRFRRLQKRIQYAPGAKDYMDEALAPVVNAEDEHLDLFEATAAARTSVAKTKARNEVIRKARHENEIPVEVGG